MSMPFNAHSTQPSIPGARTADRACLPWPHAGKPPRRWRRPPWAAAALEEPRELRIEARPLGGGVAGIKSIFYGSNGEQCGVEELALQVRGVGGSGQAGGLAPARCLPAWRAVLPPLVLVPPLHRRPTPVHPRMSAPGRASSEHAPAPPVACSTMPRRRGAAGRACTVRGASGPCCGRCCSGTQSSARSRTCSAAACRLRG